MSANLDRLRGSLAQWCQDIHSSSIDDVTNALIEEAPRRSGELASVIRSDPPTFDGTAAHGVIRAPVVQARTTELGARAHLIEGNPLLVFHWDKAGRVVFLRHVNHPGNEPRPWWQPTIEREWLPALQRNAQTTPLRAAA